MDCIVHGVTKNGTRLSDFHFHKGVYEACSVAKICLTFVTPWTAACHASLSFIFPGVGSNSCPLKQ